MIFLSIVIVETVRVFVPQEPVRMNECLLTKFSRCYLFVDGSSSLIKFNNGFLTRSWLLIYWNYPAKTNVRQFLVYINVWKEISSRVNVKHQLYISHVFSKKNVKYCSSLYCSSLLYYYTYCTINFVYVMAHSIVAETACTNILRMICRIGLW